MGMTVVNKKLAGVLVPGDHGSTFAGGPLACRAALVFLQELSEGGLLEIVAARGEQLRCGLCSMVDEFDPVLSESAAPNKLGIAVQAAETEELNMKFDNVENK